MPPLLIAGKYTIPKGTVAACAIYFLHRHPKVYKDPNTFMPERFMDNRNVSPFAFVPFSAGSRNCIGQRFAQLEEKITVDPHPAKLQSGVTGT
ncbi:hypothetical protein MRX96_013302 [Rhipicephalus microplus]